MNYDWQTAIELSDMFFIRGIERIDAIAMFCRLSIHKYPNSKLAQIAFVERATKNYDRWFEVSKNDFGRRKGKP